MSPAPTGKEPQEELIDFVTDPKMIAKAVEGSMEKRVAVLDAAERQQPDWLDKLLDEAITRETHKGSASRVRSMLKQAIRQKMAEQTAATLISLRDAPSVPPDCPNDCKKRHWHHVMKSSIDYVLQYLAHKTDKEAQHARQ